MEGLQTLQACFFSKFLTQSRRAHRLNYVERGNFDSGTRENGGMDAIYNLIFFNFALFFN